MAISDAPGKRKKCDCISLPAHLLSSRAGSGYLRCRGTEVLSFESSVCCVNGWDATLIKPHFSQKNADTLDPSYSFPGISRNRPEHHRHLLARPILPCINHGRGFRHPSEEISAECGSEGCLRKRPARTESFHDPDIQMRQTGFT